MLLQVCWMARFCTGRHWPTVKMKDDCDAPFMSREECHCKNLPREKVKSEGVFTISNFHSECCTEFRARRKRRKKKRPRWAAWMAGWLTGWLGGDHFFWDDFFCFHPSLCHVLPALCHYFFNIGWQAFFLFRLHQRPQDATFPFLEAIQFFLFSFFSLFLFLSFSFFLSFFLFIELFHRCCLNTSPFYSNLLFWDKSNSF